ncbi:Sir2 family NAD-dependent protein deacetylase [Rhabdaerophilum sp. SD176]|uniref:SIR2 family NAD-dependent protein deacylase n=1 Tax=Rhabdaerophilum sp. SD176 TaxID=2983548 RepID=UPI0024DFB676|nr:Sir2 family NAD-dependent protein deacetylase [Rhabdaerophilum sp. SD176]
MSTAPDGLLDILAKARRIVAFTGAGMSTESGVPDFRSPGSPWMANKPIPFDAFVSSAAARREAWRRKFTMDDLYRDAQPAEGHRALASLHRAGRLAGLITQNIDGLHQAAGLPPEDVVEIHGNGTYATCLECSHRHELAPIRAHFEAHGHAPACDACGGLVKSATISFGQRMPAGAMARAVELARSCDLFLVAGSSLVVYPAAELPVLARQNGATLVIINREPTPLDDLADHVWRGEIGSIFRQIDAG